MSAWTVKWSQRRTRVQRGFDGLLAHRTATRARVERYTETGYQPIELEFLSLNNAMLWKFENRRMALPEMCFWKSTPVAMQIFAVQWNWSWAWIQSIAIMHVEGTRDFAGEEESKRNRCGHSLCLRKWERGWTESDWLICMTRVWWNQLEGANRRMNTCWGKWWV